MLRLGVNLPQQSERRPQEAILASLLEQLYRRSRHIILRQHGTSSHLHHIHFEVEQGGVVDSVRILFAASSDLLHLYLCRATDLARNCQWCCLHGCVVKNELCHEVRRTRESQQF